ncbi:rRNA maturation RNase YbeY [Longimonas halophila]|uniref:Endoribonuclease YbeY n=1 Tax=Longimonas halophila TaxID=1469170 RepID=A0A2H3NMP0_9BACT|nr:rRNA maturation RNase YbeY [Longimonas halophila]PEN06043.1 rRNA maturation RNase YbeY [Longimonas halophila]
MSVPHMISIELAPELDTLPVPIDAIDRLLTQVIAEQSEQSVEALNVVFGTHTLIRSLNVQYLDHDYNTDVLAFNLSETPKALEGEVYVDVETARERHDEFDTSVSAEIARYAVHGVLHLLGHTDKTEDGQAEMRRLEDQYVQVFTNAADTPA